MAHDGLNSLKYSVQKLTELRLYTLVKADVKEALGWPFVQNWEIDWKIQSLMFDFLNSRKKMGCSRVRFWIFKSYLFTKVFTSYAYSAGAQPGEFLGCQWLPPPPLGMKKRKQNQEANQLSCEKPVTLFGFVVQWFTIVQNFRLSNWHSPYCRATCNTSLLVILHLGPQWENLATPL